MRIQLALVLILMSFNSFGVDDKSMQELFSKYDAVMDLKKTDLIEEVFSKKFIRESGGKDELIEKIKELSPPKNKAMLKSSMTWRKGLKGDIYFAKVKETSSEKSKAANRESEFVIVNEDGKLKIDGTLGDSN